MSSPPHDMSLEGLIADNWDERYVGIVLPFVEEHRADIEVTAREYDADSQSWRDCRHAVWSCVPENTFDAIEEAIDAFVGSGTRRGGGRTATGGSRARSPPTSNRVDMHHFADWAKCSTTRS